MGDPIDMNVGMFWETSLGFCNFSKKIAESMAIWMSKVDQNSTAFKNRLVVLVLFI